MPVTARRRLGALVLAAALSAALPAAAANKQVDAGKVFVQLDKYWALPPAERAHFTVAYYLRQGGQPLSVPIWLIAGGQRIPVPLNANGRVERLPTRAELPGAKLEFGVDGAIKLSANLTAEPLVAPAADLDAPYLAAAIGEVGRGMKKMAGLLAIAVPTPKAVLFEGSPSGEAELADGRRVPLPLVKGAPAYDPAQVPNARRIHLSKVPTRLDID